MSLYIYQCIYKGYMVSIYNIEKLKIEERREGGRKEESGHVNLILKYGNYGTIYLKLETS